MSSSTSTPAETAHSGALPLNEIFEKDVQRPIEGVVKADDAAHLGTEVEEYVLTNEAAKGLGQLLEAYTDYTNANGVWISGFFGSGKSHLLKMLAHLLGDVQGQDFSRQKVSAIFREKAEQGADDTLLSASLARAERIPARSLLFNIDQKATLISKDQSDALLKVFVKVFDESRGYYGNQGHVARFERDLDRRGQYEAFKAAYARIAGRDWLQGREEGVLEEGNVARAYAEVTGQTDGAPTNILTKYRTEYQVSIEDFADEVGEWLDTQQPGFRLNFFVDEVGQFIGTNTHLMLNLQTIAESLNTKCRGRAWVFVTSQEDMEKVIGDRTKSQSSDFSKIQARFATRLKLTSADVEEVIRKRLLEKNERGERALEALYKKEHANFKTLFDFADGARRYPNYRDEQQFVGTYPFVSYQFPLFQAAIEGISDHNVFEGRNSSVGERSMLGVVQQVAKHLGSSRVGALASFDQMFEGIRASLKSAAQREIDRAEHGVDDPLAVRLLKALFLVKYVESFKATARNLTVLVYDHFGLDLPHLAKHVQQALTRLEAETYVQRTGDVYAYLTNEEQAMEAEIKNVDIDASEVSTRLNQILSGEIIRTSKIRYAKNGQDFVFGYKIDDQPFGTQHDLSLHFITPESDFDLSQVRAHSAGKSELVVVLRTDPRILSDLRLLLRTEKYTKRKHTSTLSASEQQILQIKARQNEERRRELVRRLRLAVGDAQLVINATDVNSQSSDPVARVTDGFQKLIETTYTQLSLLGGQQYSEQQVSVAANPDRVAELFGDEGLTRLRVPGDEVFAFVQRRVGLGEQVTVKALVDEFQGQPYGWDLASIEVVVAWLVGTGRARLTVDGNVLKRSEVAEALRNTRKQPHTVVAPQKSYDEGQVARFRDFCRDFFDTADVPTDPAELGDWGAGRLQERLSALQRERTASNYPFMDELDGPIGLLRGVVGRPADWYLTEFDAADELLDAKSDVVDPIEAFLNGEQRRIFDDARAVLNANGSNLGYLPKDAAEPVRSGLDDPQAFRGNRMTRLKAAVNELREQVEQAVAVRRAEVRGSIEERRERLRASDIARAATEDARQTVESEVDIVLARIEAETEIPVINDAANAFEETTYPQLVDQLTNARPAATSRTETPGDSQASDSTTTVDVEPPKIVSSAPKHGAAQTVPVQQTRTSVSIKRIPTPRTRALLESEADVDEYLDVLRETLLDTIRAGKRITL
jgi:hypothetical protein